MPAHVRLDPTDAELVDVIHTDGKSIFFLGMSVFGNNTSSFSNDQLHFVINFSTTHYHALYLFSTNRHNK